VVRRVAPPSNCGFQIVILLVALVAAKATRVMWGKAQMGLRSAKDLLSLTKEKLKNANMKTTNRGPKNAAGVADTVFPFVTRSRAMY
jgi:hypothetical protein